MVSCKLYKDTNLHSSRYSFKSYAGYRVTIITLDKPFKNVYRVNEIAKLKFPTTVDIFAVPALKVYKVIIQMNFKKDLRVHVS
jgi:hypothetical protein